MVLLSAHGCSRRASQEELAKAPSQQPSVGFLLWVEGE